MGTRKPNLGNHRRRPSSARAPLGIRDALFTKTQQRLLGLLYGQPRRAYTLKELIQLAQVGSGAVQRELGRLVGSGLVAVRTEQGRKLYQASPAAPVFEELRGLIAKTVGIPEEVRAVVESASDQLRLAVLFGSVAKGTDTAESDVDVLLVSDDLTLEQAFVLFEPLERRLGRKVSPTIFSTGEFARRRRAGHPFLTKVLTGPHIVLLGREDDVLPAREPGARR